MTSMNRAKSGRPRLNERHRAQRTALIRQEIADAAIAEFTERGYHEASIANIADRLGSGPSTIYNYFTSKREILEHVVDETIGSLTTYLTGFGIDPPRTIDEFTEKGTQLGDVVATLLTSDPRRARMLLIIATSPDPALRERWTTTFNVLKAVVSQFLANGIEAGFLRAGMDTAATATAILALPMGILANQSDLEPGDERTHALVRSVVDMVTKGILSQLPGADGGLEPRSGVE